MGTRGSFLFQRLAVAAILITIALMAVSGSVQADSMGGIGGRPAHPDPKNPRTQSIFIYTLKKGATKNDQVLVSNNTSSTQNINLYAVDGEVTNTGAYTCKQKSEATQDLGGWITLESSQVTLKAGEDKAVDFTVSMPATADVGEHDACLVFENAADTGALSGSVLIHTRQAIRVVATVPGNLHRQVDITKFSVTTHGNDQQYVLSLYNNGNVSADVDSEITLTSLFGGTIYKNGGSYPVLANKKLDLTFANTNQSFWGGWYYAQGTISYSKNANNLGIKPASEDVIRKASGKHLVFIMPSLGVLIIGLLVILVAGIWFVRRRQYLREVTAWETYTVKSGETLTKIAAHSNGTNWKQIARVNKLKPPYTLEKGMKLRIPSKK